jgi:hypothetical protein
LTSKGVCASYPLHLIELLASGDLAKILDGLGQPLFQTQFDETFFDEPHAQPPSGGRTVHRAGAAAHQKRAAPDPQRARSPRSAPRGGLAVGAARASAGTLAGLDGSAGFPADEALPGVERLGREAALTTPEVTLLRGERDGDAETSWQFRPEKPEERADAIQALHDQLLFLRQLNRWVPTFHARLVTDTRS